MFVRSLPYIKKYYPLLILVGFLLWFSPFLLPDELTIKTQDHLGWGYVVTIFLLPMLGALSFPFSLYFKEKKWMLPSLMLLLAFPISIGIHLFLLFFV
ncbi:hypothetical protein BU202_04595 [Streptococcus cuniculi]|uniref:Uncharacterized protein n=2 Tax=Streptococcus cuniculi TaxID=1432788 RepID=A0A1Q8E903_9STRE|nr:hypothetical protein BU202_04595 [Streptococcus cuniculi]